MFNAISDIWDPAAGYDDVGAGLELRDGHLAHRGPKCPKDRSILTYSLSANPDSKHYADQTRMFSQKEWVDPPFCPGEVERTAKSVKIVRGG